MAEFKKMLLVPAELTARAARPSPVVGTSGVVADLDSAMTEILNGKNMNPGQKWRQYSAALEKYLHFLQENNKPVSVTLSDGASPQATHTPAPIENDVLKADLDRTVPQSFRAKAHAIYTALAAPEAQRVLSWDKTTGELTVEQNKIPGSSIIAIINDLARRRKTFNPTGWQQVADALPKINLPAGLIGNRKYASASHDQAGGGAGRLKSTQNYGCDHAPPTARSGHRATRGGSATRRGAQKKKKGVRATARRAKGGNKTTRRGRRPPRPASVPFQKWQKW